MSSGYQDLELKQRVPQDVIFQLHEPGNWVIYNVFTQDSLAVTPSVRSALSVLSQNKPIKDITHQYATERRPLPP